MKNTDFKKTLKTLYAPPQDRFVTVGVPQMAFVKVDGSGDPNTVAAYRSAVEWLYSTIYAMKFASRAALAQDYIVPPLEGLWWADDPQAFAARDKDLWQWTMMIMVPDSIPRTMFDDAVAKSSAKLGQPPQSLRLEPYAEGMCLQILHIGSYDDEAPVLARLHDAVMPDQGMTFKRPHHEIYLSDPRRRAPATLRTILRQPVRPVAKGGAR